MARLFQFSNGFVIFLLFAMVGIVAYYVVLFRVKSAGVKVKYFASLSDILRLFRQYRALASQNNWSLWPIYVYWSALAAIFIMFFPPLRSLR